MNVSNVSSFLNVSESLNEIPVVLTQQNVREWCEAVHINVVLGDIATVLYIVIGTYVLEGVYGWCQGTRFEKYFKSWYPTVVQPTLGWIRALMFIGIIVIAARGG